MLEEKYFSKDYFDAKGKFIEATKELKCDSFPIGKDLTIDCALSESRKKDTLVIFQSGIHGVEGYLGSAFQLYLLDKFLKKFNSKFSVAFIHALNPYGFSHNRRYNENNVDLNRNSINNFKGVSKIDPLLTTIIQESQSILTPMRARASDFKEYFLHYFRLLKIIFRFGLKDTIKSAAFGQNMRSESVCFCGNKKEKSTMFFERYLKKVTKGYKRAILIDLHAGTGKKYDFNGFTTSLPESPEFNFFKGLVLDLKDTNKTNDEGVDHLGGINENFLKSSKAKKNLEMTAEFGTVGRISIVFSLAYLSRLLVAENQITHYGPKRRLREIRDHFKKAYFPDSKKYRKFLITCAENFGESLLGKF